MSENPLIHETILRFYENKVLLYPLYSPIALPSLLAGYIIETLEMSPIAYIDIEEISPLVYAAEGKLIHPYTIYFSPKHPLLVFKLPPDIDYEKHLKLFPKIAKEIVTWCNEQEIGKIMALDFMPPRNEKAEKVYFITEEHLVDDLKKLGLQPYTGVYLSTAGYLLNQCAKTRVDGIILRVESDLIKAILETLRKEEIFRDKLTFYQKMIDVFSKYGADLSALKRALNAIEKITKIKIPLEKLEERNEEYIELMQQLLEAISKEIMYKKSKRPPIYG
ncbi:MAG: hypothetical protein DRJ52_09195 [Thermoprotei archaeon]|nr:MAG: hypothetical protein DRJ52_09195 [Thermoprotei archaeon]